MTPLLKKFWLRRAGKRHLLKTGADERVNMGSASPTGLDALAATAADTDKKKGGLPHATANVKEAAADDPASAQATKTIPTQTHTGGENI